MQYSDDAKTCTTCGLTSPGKHLRTLVVNGAEFPVCLDAKACELTRAKNYPLPAPPPPPSEHQPGLVPPEHVETNKRALEEKERLRWKDEEHRRRRLGLDQGVKVAPAMFEQKGPVLA